MLKYKTSASTLYSNYAVFTVKPVLGTSWELRTATPVPRPIQDIKIDLRNKTTSEFRTVFHSPLGVPNSKVPLYINVHGVTVVFTLSNSCYPLAYDRQLELAEGDKPHGVNIQNEATWFMKVGRCDTL